MVTFNFEDGSSMTLQNKTKVEDTNEQKDFEGAETDRADYHYYGQEKGLKPKEVTKDYPNVYDVKSDTQQTESLTDKDIHPTKTLKYKSESMRTASPMSVLSQFKQGFMETLMALPDYAVTKTAQGISDTFNLGWNDDDIFQFADLINKGKV